MFFFYLFRISFFISDFEYIFFSLALEVSDNGLTPIVGAMKDKFLKYWERVPPVTIIANCLHPTYKKYYTVKMLRFYNNNLGLACGDEDPSVTKILEDMFNIYYNRRGDSSQQQSASASTSTRQGGRGRYNI